MKNYFLIVNILIGSVGYGIESTTPVAKVGKYVITVSDFQTKYKPRGEVNRDSLKQSVLEELIADKLMLIDAYEKGFDKEEKIKDQLISHRNRTIISKLYEQVVVKRAKVLPHEVRNEWWKRKVTLKLSQITVKTEHPSWESQNKWWSLLGRRISFFLSPFTVKNDKIRKIYQELRDGVKFEDVARKYSEDHQARYGGEISEVRWGQLESGLERVAFSLKCGEISPPIKVRDGYKIIKIKERKEKKGLNFEKEKSRIEENLKGKRRSTLANKYIEFIKKIAYPKYNLKVIEELSKSPDSVNKDEVIMSWAGGEITVDYFLKKVEREIKMGRLQHPEAIKSRLRNLLTYEILLPIHAMRYRLHRLPKVKEELRRREETLLIREYQNKEIDGKVSVTDEEVEEYYETHRDKYEGDFERMKSRVRWDLEREKKKERREEVIKNLKAKIRVEKFENVLKEIE